MAIPLHTFEPTGDLVVDDLNFFIGRPENVTFYDWFESNSHVLLHTADEIIRDAEPYEFMMTEAPWDPGIYVLLLDDRIAYVGKGLSVGDRIHSHMWNGKKFNRYWCFGGVPYEWLDEVEKHYIGILKPYLNRMNTLGTSAFDKILKKLAKKQKAAAGQLLDSQTPV